MIECVAEEDLLIPVAVTDGVFWFVVPRDRLLYSLDVGGYTRAPLPTMGRVFVVPGSACVFQLDHQETSIRVTRRSFHPDAAPQSCRLDSVPAATSHVLRELIPGPATVAAVFDPISGRGPRTVVDLCGGASVCVAADPAYRPHRLLRDGVIAAQSSDGWALVVGDRLYKSGGGRIRGTTETSILVSDRPDLERRWRVIHVDSETTVAVGDATILNAAMAGDDLVCHVVDASGRQAVVRRRHGTWHEVASGGTSVVHDMAGDEPVVRTTGVSLGSRWRCGDSEVAGAASSRPEIEMAVVKVSGLPTVIVRRRQAASRRLVVSLHGGPDSHELDDLRYGGLYRDLADDGADVAVINYPGSADLGVALQRRAWHDRIAVNAAVVSAIGGLMASGRYESVSILGVSFGAWIGLQVADDVGADVVVVASPVLEMGAHIRRHRDEVAFAEWADRRFTSTDLLDGDRDAANCRCAVTAVLPRSDEVVGPSTVAFAHERGWNVVPVDGRHYPTTGTEAIGRWSLLRRALTPPHPGP
ncbi:hypothetical protein [Williamsia sp.]|uniref:hypothetical protein n=1 Tax=Williamsia sp. TaxID=1872085 RepID=UPI001A228426|nr:hypothetical protein [Williamsia sp.]MBJ7291698.1 hypothetical protein [Williamsia sp.]